MWSIFNRVMFLAIAIILMSTIFRKIVSEILVPSRDPVLFSLFALSSTAIIWFCARYLLRMVDFKKSEEPVRVRVGEVLDYIAGTASWLLLAYHLGASRQSVAQLVCCAVASTLIVLPLATSLLKYNCAHVCSWLRWLACSVGCGWGVLILYRALERDYQ